MFNTIDVLLFIVLAMICFLILKEVVTPIISRLPASFGDGKFQRTDLFWGFIFLLLITAGLSPLIFGTYKLW